MAAAFLTISAVGAIVMVSIHMQKILLFMVIGMLAFVDVHANEPLVLGKPVDPIAEISSRVLEEAYNRIGIQVEFRQLPAERSLVQSDQGLLDGEVNRIKGIETAYPNLIRIPVPVNTVEQSVFSAKHDFPVIGWASLKPYSIAIRIGTKVVEYNTRGMDVAAFPTYDKVFTLLSMGRYDVAVAASVTGLFYIKKHNLKTIKRLSPPLTKHPLYHYIHRKNEHLIPQITAVLKNMQQDGRILQARDRFIAELSH